MLELGQALSSLIRLEDTFIWFYVPASCKAAATASRLGEIPAQGMPEGGGSHSP